MHCIASCLATSKKITIIAKCAMKRCLFFFCFACTLYISHTKIDKRILLFSFWSDLFDIIIVQSKKGSLIVMLIQHPSPSFLTDARLSIWRKENAENKWTVQLNDVRKVYFIEILMFILKRYNFMRFSSKFHPPNFICDCFSLNSYFHSFFFVFFSFQVFWFVYGHGFPSTHSFSSFVQSNLHLFAFRNDALRSAKTWISSFRKHKYRKSFE